MRGAALRLARWFGCRHSRSELSIESHTKTLRTRSHLRKALARRPRAGYCETRVIFLRLYTCFIGLPCKCWAYGVCHSIARLFQLHGISRCRCRIVPALLKNGIRSRLPTFYGTNKQYVVMFIWLARSLPRLLFRRQPYPGLRIGIFRC